MEISYFLLFHYILPLSMLLGYLCLLYMYMEIL